MVQFNAEQAASAGRVLLESLGATASIQLSAFEKIAQLNLRTLQQAAQACSSGTQALIGTRDAQRLPDVPSLALPFVECASEFMQAAVKIGSETNAELVQLTQRRAAELNGLFEPPARGQACARR